jgi:hypothetical protein
MPGKQPTVGYGPVLSCFKNPKPLLGIHQARKRMLLLGKGSRSLTGRQVRQRFYRPGRVLAWAASDQAGDDDPIQQHIVAAGCQPRESIGHQQWCSMLEWSRCGNPNIHPVVQARSAGLPRDYSSAGLKAEGNWQPYRTAARVKRIPELTSWRCAQHSPFV